METKEKANLPQRASNGRWTWFSFYPLIEAQNYGHVKLENTITPLAHRPTHIS